MPSKSRIRIDHFTPDHALRAACAYSAAYGDGRRPEPINRGNAYKVPCHRCQTPSTRSPALYIGSYHDRPDIRCLKCEYDRTALRADLVALGVFPAPRKAHIDSEVEEAVTILRGSVIKGRGGSTLYAVLTALCDIAMMVNSLTFGMDLRSLASAAGVSCQTISKALRATKLGSKHRPSLIDLGYVECIKKGKGRNASIWKLLPPSEIRTQPDNPAYNTNTDNYIPLSNNGQNVNLNTYFAHDAARHSTAQYRGLGKPKTRILIELATGSSRVQKVSRATGISDRMVQRHLRALRALGIVSNCSRLWSLASGWEARLEELIDGWNSRGIGAAQRDRHDAERLEWRAQLYARQHNEKIDAATGEVLERGSRLPVAYAPAAGDPGLDLMCVASEAATNLAPL